MSDSLTIMSSSSAPVSGGGEPRVPVRLSHQDFRSEDGFPIAGELFEHDSAAADAPVVLVSSAAAVPHGFYSAYARHLVERGAAAALTYDYRGVARSAVPEGWAGRIRMIDWGRQDFVAAAEHLQSQFPGRRLVGVGQSYGGQALGISGISDRFDRYAMVATLSGYYRNLDTPMAVWARMNLVGVPLSLALGRTPRWAGGGEPLPGSVFRDWARWCRSPDYFFSDPRYDMTARFAAVVTPILAIRVEDDPWGTDRALEGLLSHYCNAPLERLVVGIRDTGGEPIGHLGFFRRRFTDSLWPRLTDWLLAASGQPTRSPSMTR